MSAGPFKKVLLAYLQSHIEKQAPLTVIWRCTVCTKEHRFNLLDGVAMATKGEASGDINPDISLMSDDQQLYAVIHVTVNKRPIEKHVNHYQTKGLLYLQVNPGDDVVAAISEPKYVGWCLNPRCTTCGSFRQEKNIMIIDTSCWRCNGPIKAAVAEWAGYHAGPDEFTAEELAVAADKGAIIKTNYSKTMETSYLANTCPWCHTFIGNHFLPEYYYEAIYGSMPYERVSEGFFCKVCG